MEKITTFFSNFWQKANKKKLIGAAIALFVVIAATIGILIYLNTPSVLAARTVAKFAKDLTKRDEIQTITQTLTQGSIEASLSSVKVDDEEYLEDASISGKAYFSSDALMLENIKVNFDDFKLSGNVYLSSDLVYIQEDEILDGAYGIEIDNLATDLRGSIFAYGSGSKYQLFYDEDLYNALLESCEDAEDEKMVKEAEKIITDYTKHLYKSLCEHGEITTDKDNIRVDGKKQNVRVITISIDEKAAAAIAEDMLNYIVEDDSVVKFIEKYETRFAVMKLESGIEDLVAWYEDMMTELEDVIDDVCEEIEDNDFDLDVEMVTPRNSAKLLKLNVIADGDELFSLDLGKDGIKKSQKITLSSGGSKLVYEIKENSNKVYKSSLKFDNTEYLSINIDYDKEKYEINIGDKDYEWGTYVTAKGKISKSGKTFNISLDKIEVTENNYYYGSYTTTVETNLELVVKTKDKMPKAPTDYALLDEITEEEIDAWGERIRENNQVAPGHKH